MDSLNPGVSQGSPGRMKAKQWFQTRGRGGKKKENQPNMTRSSRIFENTDLKNVQISNKSTKKDTRRRKEKEKFEEYKTAEEIEEGMKKGTIVIGALRINPRRSKEAFVSSSFDTGDIMIDGILDRNQAFENDEVAVEIKPKTEWIDMKNGRTQVTGKVVGLIEKINSRIFVGTLAKQKTDKIYIKMVPKNPKLPCLFIPRTFVPVHILNNLESYENTLFKATLLNWNDVAYPLGKIEDEIGLKGELEAEVDAIMAELDLDKEPVPDHLCKFISSTVLSQEEMKYRLDLRKECVFSIDPETARDLDDAVSIKIISNSEYEVGVHIADVSHFLLEGSPLDECISNRATTVYLVHRVYHMLPERLTMHCSLLPGEDKRAFSVIWRIRPDGTVLSTSYKKTLIRSVAQLSYEQAQDIIDNKEIELPSLYGDFSSNHIKDCITRLHLMTSQMTKRRFDNGALRLHQLKPAFTLDSQCNPTSVSTYKIKESNRLIEELMLLANESVAKLLDEACPDIAFLRNHLPPKQDMIMKLEESLESLGLCIDTETAGSLHSCLQDFEEDISKHTVLMLFYLKSMQRALYFCNQEEKSHYTLNCPLYTHFTSPIRRYADVVVHRQLAAVIGIQEYAPHWSCNHTSRFAKNCNRKKYAAKRAGDLSCELFTSLYVRKAGNCKVEGIVYATHSQSFDVIIFDMAFNMRVYTDKLNATVDFLENGMASILRIAWKDFPEQIIKVFSIVTINLTPKDDLLSIEATLLPT